MPLYVVDYIGYWLYGNTHVCLYCVGLPGKGCTHKASRHVFPTFLAVLDGVQRVYAYSKGRGKTSTEGDTLL